MFGAIAGLSVKIAISLLTKLITETFLARILIELLRVWAKSTPNIKWDDRIVEEAAKAFGVPPENLQ